MRAVFLFLKPKSDIHAYAGILRIFGEVAGEIIVLADIRQAIAIAGADGEILDVKADSAHQTKIPAVKVTGVKLRSVFDVSVVVDILDIGVHEISCIAAKVQVEIGRQVDNGQHRQLDIAQVEAIFTAALDKIAVRFFCAFEAVEQFRLDGKAARDRQLGIDTGVEAGFHVFTGDIADIKTREVKSTFYPELWT